MATSRAQPHDPFVVNSAPSQVLEANRLLELLLELDGAEREEELLRSTHGKPELEALVRRLLTYASMEDSLPDVRDSLRSAAEGAILGSGLTPGLTIGNYSLVERVGAGGHGEVWLAERKLDELVQRVAIKFLIEHQRESRSFARFRREQSILAQLNHPSIAKILDVGVTHSGRPYFAMEFVDGMPIDQWCDQHNLDIRERLTLFTHVVDAVSHAHAALILHRDIKPGNVLVDKSGFPKLLDFGIAKLLQDTSADLTEPGASPVTLGFASPEQLGGKSVSVTTDVYQLGVLLYLLVSGLRPQPSAGVSREELLQLTNFPAEPPSRQLQRLLKSRDEQAQSIAHQRRRQARQLIRDLERDVDFIVSKAIAVDPSDRYQSAAQLTDDVNSFLQGLPVRARKREWRYIALKAVYRHPAAALLGFALFASLVVFSVLISKVALDLDASRRSALLRGELSDRVLHEVVTALRELEPDLSGFEGSIARKALDRVAESNPSLFGEDPATQSQLRIILGRGYDTLWAIDKAQKQYELVLESVDSLPAAEQSRIKAQALNGLGRTHSISGDFDKAEELFKSVLAINGNSSDLEYQSIQALRGLSAIEDGRGNQSESRRMIGEALQRSDVLLGPAHPETIRLRFNTALVLIGEQALASREDIEGAQQALHTIRRLAPASIGDRHTLLLATNLLLGRSYCYLREYARCSELLREQLPIASQVLGEQSLSVLKARAEFGLALVMNGESESGLTELSDAASVFNKRWNGNGTHPVRHDFGINLAIARLAMGSEEQALAELVRFNVDQDLVTDTPELKAISEQFRERQSAPN